MQHEASLDALICGMTGNPEADAVCYLKHQKHLLKGWTRKKVPALTRLIKADLVIMGTVGRTGVPGFVMGNTAETDLDLFDCSILALRPSGFVTPAMLED